MMRITEMLFEQMVERVSMKLNKEKLLELYKPYTNVLGPYKRSDGRQHIVLNNSNAPRGEKGKTKTISYPKAIAESNLNRRLLKDETIDHNDRNFDNNVSNNLIVRDRSEHAALDATRVLIHDVTCPVCGSLFTPTLNQTYSKTAGPFCSKRCSGLYGKSIQKGEKPLDKTKIVKTYYQLSKVN